MKENFSAALRAEIDALVTRYEAIVASRLEIEAREAAREAEALRGEVAALRAERDALSRELEGARARVSELEAEVRAGAVASSALEAQFEAEKQFVASSAELSGTLMEEALRAEVGRELGPSPAVYAALKGKGLEAVLIGAFKERGRSIAHAGLLERERGALRALAAAAGCELVVPERGARFSAAGMEKAATVSDPAEEGNVVECLLPGLRRTGTEGSLVFPRVRVATA